MRVAGTPSAMARAFTLKRSGVRYSSRSTSPGCTARMRLTGRPISILLSVIVHDLDIGRTGHGPHKAHPPLIVDANAPLTDASAPERFEPISRRRSDEIQDLGCVQHGELASGDGFNGAKTLRMPAFEHGLRVLAAKRLDHVM